MRQIAILISDVHYSLPTLEIAEAAMRLAVAKANSLKVPLIVCGDLHETKANLRAECVNAMIATMKIADIMPIVLVGNHDLINEKSDRNSLGFLEAYVELIDEPSQWLDLPITFIPYQSDKNKFIEALSWCSTLIVVSHQGLTSSLHGEYLQDKSAVTPKDVAGRRVISGHYHTRQTIKLPEGGSWDYVGNPYTLNFGEAHDPEKGFQILYEDGSLEFVPTNLRKHIVIKMDEASRPNIQVKPGDIVLVKLSGTREHVSEMTKVKVGQILGLKEFRLDVEVTGVMIPRLDKVDGPKLLDAIIDASDNSADLKQRLKSNWRKLCS